MYYKISKFFLYLSLLSPLFLIKAMFFPFIAGKAIFFRSMVELALLFFVLHILAHLHNADFLKRLREKLSHPFVICVSIFAILFAITSLTGVNPTQSFWSNFERGEGAFQVLHYALFFVLVFLAFSERKSMERFLIANIAVSIPVCVYALLQLVTPIGSNNWFVIAPGDRVSGTLGNPSYLAAYLLFILAFLAYFFITYKDPVWRTLIGILSAFEIFIFLCTGTRAAFLGIIAALLIIAILQLFTTRSHTVRLWLSGILGAGILVLIIFFASHRATVWQHVPVLNRIINISSAVNDLRPRLWTWGSAVSGVLERPVFGWGAENYAYPFDKYYNPNHYGIESFFDRTHNIFLEYAISGGIALLLAWLTIFFFYYKRLLQRERDLWFSILFAVPVAYLVQGFFLFDTLPIYLVFFVFLALVASAEATGVHLSPERDGGLAGANIGTAVIVAASIGALLYYGSWLPIRKNALLVEALILQNQFAAELNAGQKPTIDPSKVILAYHRAIDAKSPVGREEAIGSYEKFVLSLVEATTQNPEILKDPRAKAQIRALVDDANKQYDANLTLYPGLKQQYVNGGINLRAGYSFGQKDYLERGKRMFYEALQTAPTRLEFMRVIIELARLENDSETLSTWGRRAAFYRPDIFKFADQPATAK